MRVAAGAVLLGLALAAVVGWGGTWAADPSALWKIVDGQCVPHQEADRDPAPCSAVDLTGGVGKGYAILKDLRGVAQFLLIPTARIGGIEDKAILAPGAANYWDGAWRARSFVEERLRKALPRDAVALAINSIFGRTQNQLHIHIDCIRPDVRAALAADLDQVRGVWTPFPVPLVGHTYRAIRIGQEMLDGVNPFRVLAEADPPPRDMALHTLVLAAVRFPEGGDGFVLLDDHADLARGDRGAGEMLLDRNCSVAER